MRTKHLSTLVFGGSLLATLLSACSGDEPLAPRKMEVRKLNTVSGEITTLVPVGQPDHIEKIIGENDLTPVLNDGANIPKKYQSIINAFGRMSMGCTATHIGNGLVLTAGHCFEAPAKRKDNATCAGIKVEWGVRKDKAAYLTSNCVKILAYETNDDRDYAIYTVDKIPEQSIEVDLQSRVSNEAIVTIFGHPQLRPLEWSKVCPVKPGKGNPDQTQDWGVDQFAHQCDTEPGNSGSTVIDDTTLKVIGIHDGGLSPWNYATYIVNTPLAEILGKPQPVPTATIAPQPQPTATVAPQPVPTATVAPQPQPTPPAGQYPKDQTFGPFGNDEDRVLLEIKRGEDASSVSFELETDTEESYDRVILTHGSGWAKRTLRFSGIDKRTFTNLRTPVTIRFVSDEEVTSQSVTIRNLEVK